MTILNNGTITLTLADTAYQIPSSAHASRKQVIINNTARYPIHIGGSNLTTSNGIIIQPFEQLKLNSSEGVYALCETAAEDISYIELG
tara:strand:- start:1015 stop:1278 length:264 start_codon:yes stop_codon:yes gene_type:complete